jgi:large subunit ribosomal protein L3
MKGRKMAGQYGNVKTTVKNEVISYDAENGILVVAGSIPGANGAMGRVKVVK